MKVVSNHWLLTKQQRAKNENTKQQCVDMGIGIVSPTFALKIKSIVLFVNELNFSFMVYHIRS